MATRFEVALVEDQDPIRLRAAAEEALAEVGLIEGRLSLYLETSEIARINALAAHQAVRVSTEVFQLLAHCRRLYDQTQGCFDPTVGPLMKCWGFVRESGRQPGPGEIEQAMERVGMRWVELEESRSEVRFLRSGMALDLGAVGKGYAIDVAVRVLREAGIENGLIHGGTSSVYALGHQEDGRPWTIAVEAPPDSGTDSPLLLSALPLRDEALSVSAVWGKSFRTAGRRFGHVLDPRTGNPVQHTQLAAVTLPSTAESDAVSTALLTLGRPGLPVLQSCWPSMRAVVLGEDAVSVDVL